MSTAFALPTVIRASSFRPFVRPPISPLRLSRRLCCAITMSDVSTARRILVSIGHGSEEIETAAAVDTFVRAGAEVTLASVEDTRSVKMSRGMTYLADTLIDDVKGSFDAIALPGGMPGAERLRDSSQLVTLLKQAKENDAIIAAVCASPAVVLAEHGFLENVSATCYPVPMFRDRVQKAGTGDVVVDGKTITGTGPGTAIKWALAVVEALYGKDKADQLSKEMLAPRD